MVARAIGLPLRGLEFVFTLIIMALVGNMIAQAYHGGNPASVNYAMFTSAFSMFSLFFLVPTTWNPDWGFHAVIPIVLDVLNSIFFLTAGITLAARLEAHSCSNKHYLAHNDVTNNSHHREKRCREGQASTAFLWFAWACYTASLIISVLAARSTGVNLGTRRGVRRGPAMSQV